MDRNEIRRLQKAAREGDRLTLGAWGAQFEAQIREQLRIEFNNMYQEEIAESIDNLLVALAYTLHFNEDLKLGPKRLPSFMEDLFVTIDMFRTGEYTPLEYKEELEKAGIKFDKDQFRQRERKIVTLCGSSKFKDIFKEKEIEYTKKGYIVLSPGIFDYSDLSEEELKELKDLHLRKIDLCDFIYVINKDKVLESTTKDEIQYAVRKLKKIVYLEEDDINGNKDTMLRMS